jgi:perosamine synthetase
VEQVLRLEAEWATSNSTEKDCMVACSSGTAALHLAFEALQLRRGGEVLMCDFNMVACPRAAVMAGLQPRFVDCRSDLCIDVDKLEAALTDDTVAILATHIYGRRCNMDRIHDMVSGRSIAVVEDLAEAHGVRPHEYTDAACWSFYRNKIVAGEEGGAVAFYSPREADLARQLRCLGFTDKHDYDHVPRGHNYRLADCLAQKVRTSLASYLDNAKWREKCVQAYIAATPFYWLMGPRSANWVYDFRIPGLLNIDEVVSELQKVIPARHGFKPMSTQREFINLRHVRENAYLASREVIYLPLFDVTTRSRIYQEVIFDMVRRVAKTELQVPLC